MKLTVSAVTCLVAIYFMDMYFFDGAYFNAVRDIMYHVWNGY